MKAYCRFFSVVFILFLSLTVIHAQDEEPFCSVLSGSEPQINLSQLGGVYLTSTGLVRVLVVFVSSAQDQSPHPFWPVGAPPAIMQNFIDSNAVIGGTNYFNLTNYFRQMSIDTYQVVGRAIWIETPYDWTHYGRNYRTANREILRDLVDPLINFSEYDNWHRNSDYVHVNNPDGVVDMIVMVYRGNYLELNSGGTLGGIADLGGGSALPVDSVEIHFGWPGLGDQGSGVTCQWLTSWDDVRLFKLAVHEIGHWLIPPHPYGSSIYSFWGILADGYRSGICANAFERERLGWINIPEVTGTVNAQLSDFITTGSAYKFHPPNGDPNEYFYFENHQHMSIYDDPSLNSTEKGMWIIHQRGPYNNTDNIRTINSDGRWNWQSVGFSQQCVPPNSLPIFEKLQPNRVNGYTHRDRIAAVNGPIGDLITYQTPKNQIICGGFFRGIAPFYGAYNFTLEKVFSPWSNPSAYTWTGNSTTFAAELQSELNGTYTAHFLTANPESAPPSKPQNINAFFPSANTVKVYWTQNIEPNMTQGNGYGYDIYRSVYYNGATLLYTKLNSSLVTSSSFTDISIPSRPPVDTVYLRYHVRAFDNTSKASLVSEDGWLNMDAPVINSILVTLNLASYLDPGIGGTYKIDSINVGPSWCGAIQQGQSIKIEAVPPNTEWKFLNWSDASTQNPRTLTPTGDTILNFVCRKKYSFTVSLNVSNSIEQGGGTYEVMDNYVGTSWTQTLLEKDSIKIKAVPLGGWFFLGWSDGVTTNPRSIIVNSNITLSAVYKMHLGSSIPTATSNNSQRKIVRDPRGTLHAVYESGGKIWYISSMDDGITWSTELQVNDNISGSSHHNPSISYTWFFYDMTIPPGGTRVIDPIITWETRSDISNDYQIQVKDPIGHHFQQYLPSVTEKYTSSNFSNPSICDNYIFFRGPDGIYYSKALGFLGLKNFTYPIKINGTSQESQSPSADGRHVVWEENGDIKYCDVDNGSIETVASATVGEINSAPCISLNESNDAWIAWEYSNTGTSFEAIKVRNRTNTTNTYGTISVFHDSTQGLYQPQRRPSIFTDKLGHNSVFLLWDDSNSVKEVNNMNGEWSPIETIQQNVYAAQICIRDTVGTLKEVALFSGLQGSPYPLISYPFYTYPSTAIFVSAGWNFVSVPRVQTNYNASTVFPDCFGDMFGFDAASSSYVLAPILTMGPGYWAFFLNASTISVSGAPGVGPISISCQTGWNLIGSREVPVATSALTTNPAGKILGDFFSYDSGQYISTTVLIPGKAAWVYVTGTCTMIIP